MKLVMMRHGMTLGNEQKRYIGRTDEPLSEKGIAQLITNKAAGRYPAVQRVLVSPMKRCRQTAALVYPDQEIQVVEAFRECDFGSFEGKNYRELQGDKRYQQWIDSMGTLPFPDGESMQTFRQRTIKAFASVMDALQQERLQDGQPLQAVAMLVHGGTIMSVMEQFAIPKRTYYAYQVENAGGYLVDYEEGRLVNGRNL